MASSDSTVWLRGQSNRLPSEITGLMQILKKGDAVDKSIFRAMLKLIITELEGRELPSDAYQRINPNNKLELDVCMSGLHRICRSAVRRSHFTSPSSSADFKNQMLSLGMPDEFAQDMSTALFGSRRDSMLEHRLTSAPSVVFGGNAALPLAQGDNVVSWRCDVIPGERMRAAILMDIVTADGKKRTLQIPPKVFHRMRLSVAEALKALAEVEST